MKFAASSDRQFNYIFYVATVASLNRFVFITVDEQRIVKISKRAQKTNVLHFHFESIRTHTHIRTHCSSSIHLTNRKPIHERIKIVSVAHFDFHETRVRNTFFTLLT